MDKLSAANEMERPCGKDAYSRLNQFMNDSRVAVQKIGGPQMVNKYAAFSATTAIAAK